VNYKIIIHNEVSQEVDEITEWYNKQQPRLGGEFIYEFESLIKCIRQIPMAFPIAFRDFREVMLKRFPFVILTIENESVFICNIIHIKQHPQKRIRVTK
jgi:hypothetical protein